MTKHIATPVAMAAELQTETSAGRLMAEFPANSMARLVQKHIGPSGTQSLVPRERGGLDRRRLLRVLDYIEANLEGDLSVERMATIACLSRFHFARSFRQAVGQSPHRYVSAKRLERAKALLMHGDRPLVDIALALSFSSQANFTRAFKQATGRAPGQFRQEGRSRKRGSLFPELNGLFRPRLEFVAALALPQATNDNAAAFELKHSASTLRPSTFEREAHEPLGSIVGTRLASA
jgi:AraC-like DNA-binding protein